MSYPVWIDCFGEEESSYHVRTISDELVGCLHECHASCDDVIYEDDVLPATSLALMVKFSAGFAFLPVMWPDSWSMIGWMVW